MAMMRVVAAWCVLCGVVSAGPVLIGGGADPFGDLPGPWGPDAATQNPALPGTPNTSAPVAGAGQVPNGATALPVIPGTQSGSGGLNVNINGDSAPLQLSGVSTVTGAGTAWQGSAGLGNDNQRPSLGGWSGSSGTNELSDGGSGGILGVLRSSNAGGSSAWLHGWSGFNSPGGNAVDVTGPSTPSGSVVGQSISLSLPGRTVYLNISTDPVSDLAISGASVPAWASQMADPLNIARKGFRVFVAFVFAWWGLRGMFRDLAGL